MLISEIVLISKSDNSSYLNTSTPSTSKQRSKKCSWRSKSAEIIILAKQQDQLLANSEDNQGLIIESLLYTLIYEKDSGEFYWYGLQKFVKHSKFHALPISSLELRLDDNTVYIAVHGAPFRVYSLSSP